MVLFVLKNTVHIVKNNCIGSRRNLSSHMATLKEFQGQILVNAKELDLDLSLLGGQSFRWEKSLNEDKQNIWHGVAYNIYWELTQNPENLTYKAYANVSEDQLESEPTNYEEILKRYLRLDFDLSKNIEAWRKSHQHFDELSPRMKAVRVLDQEPLENIISFICSQNNHIKRISSMINWFCSKYGTKIGHFHSKDQFTFPALDALVAVEKESGLESILKNAKFGYRAKFIAKSISSIDKFGGASWLNDLRSLPYSEARNELVKLPGVGFKVADCICLMSLNHLDSVPIDTHIFKVAQKVYMPELSKVKAVTPKIYEDIAENFRKIYGPYAGWTQAVLFCAELQQFQNPNNAIKQSSSKIKRKGGDRFNFLTRDLVRKRREVKRYRKRYQRRKRRQASDLDQHYDVYKSCLREYKKMIELRKCELESADICLIS